MDDIDSQPGWIDPAEPIVMDHGLNANVQFTDAPELHERRNVPQPGEPSPPAWPEFASSPATSKSGQKRRKSATMSPTEN